MDVFNFECTVLDVEAIGFPESPEIFFESPVPIWSGDRELGFASLRVSDSNVVTADCFLVVDCPERLDIENQDALWLLPHITVQRRWPYNGTRPVKVTVTRLEFHKEVDDISLPKAWEHP